MTIGDRTPWPRSTGKSIYELTVSGTIGPVVRSCFPDLVARELPSHSVIKGHCAGPAELRELLDLLSSNGFPANTLVIDGPAPLSPGHR